MMAISQWLSAEGFSMENYFEESFGDPIASKVFKAAMPNAKLPEPAVAESDASEPSVAFAISGKVACGDELDTLLDNG